MGFQRFHGVWLKQLDLLRQLLVSAKAENGADDRDRVLRRLIKLVLGHYQTYYTAKSLAARQDLMSIWAAEWANSFERTFLWITGWRPTVAFHIVYTECGQQFESQLENFLSGIRTGDLGDLSPSQLSRVSEMQCETIQEENELTKHMTELQDNLADLMASSEFDIMLTILEMGKIIDKADNLRLKTLQQLTELLNPLQTVDFLIVLSELLIKLHEFGAPTHRSD